jgi:hypothetical protein
VDGASHHLFAGTRLAFEHDGQVALGRDRERRDGATEHAAAEQARRKLADWLRRLGDDAHPTSHPHHVPDAQALDADCHTIHLRAIAAFEVHDRDLTVGASLQRGVSPRNVRPAQAHRRSRLATDDARLRIAPVERKRRVRRQGADEH